MTTAPTDFDAIWQDFRDGMTALRQEYQGREYTNDCREALEARLDAAMVKTMKALRCWIRTGYFLDGELRVTLDPGLNQVLLGLRGPGESREAGS
jgi:hypothetical protein